MYAGFRGPLDIGGITIDPFPFAAMAREESAKSLNYVKTHMQITREPVVQWRGTSKTALQYTVKNNGDRRVTFLTVRLATTNGSFVDLPLHGPFRGGKTTTAATEVPSNVSRAYFTREAVHRNEVIAARF
jgi:hypothetical protein